MPPARVLLYLATAGAIGLMIRAIAVAPPPPWVAIAALAGYVALVTLGICFAGYGMFADVVTLGPEGARGVALTFDDGPDQDSTPRILDLLDEASVKATFFVIGHKVEAHPAIVRDIVARGHGLGIHGYRHERFLSLRSPAHVKRDLERAIAAIDRAAGCRPTLFRPPIGHMSPAMARVARELELSVIGWSVRGIDGWSGAKPARVAERVIRGLDDGAIVLLHDAAERGGHTPASIEALPRILAAAEDRRLTFVRLDRWLDEGDDDERDAALG